MAGHANPALPGETQSNNKTGTIWTSIGHIFCAVVGAGVLGLPNAVAWWGWIIGPLWVVLFFAVSLWTSLMLASVYRVGDKEFGRFYRAVYSIMGNGWGRFAWVLQLINLILFTLAYTITGSISMRISGERMGSSWTTQWQLVLLLGAIEIALSQIPNLEECWWVSAIGAICSLTYCGIALILGCIYASNRQGSVAGREGNSSIDKGFSMLNALGSIAFAYTFSLVLLEIQDTLRQPPCAIKTMRKAINVAVSAAFLFYLTVAVTGYAALGSAVPGEVLDGFPDAPNWVIVVANLAVALHMITAIQLFAQPIFHTGENILLRRRARKMKQQQLARSASNASSFDKMDKDGASSVGERSLHRLPSMPSPYAPPITQEEEEAAAEAGEAALAELAKRNPHSLPYWQRFCVRTGYVLFMCVIGIVMPFFSPFIGLAGSLIFWPLCVFLPCLMYVRIYQPTGVKLLAVKAVNVFMAIVAVGALIGSGRALVVSWSSGFELFQ